MKRRITAIAGGVALAAGALLTTAYPAAADSDTGVMCANLDDMGDDGGISALVATPVEACGGNGHG
ncbi:hypothetical protein ABT063_11650 [Streptomyces sp. NPDC002838]|uniref:hypothetical protein n=1 Tax=Streptomyces sp. NPDC002838 TaxID=3154436 RepID=UPI00333313F4